MGPTGNCYRTTDAGVRWTPSRPDLLGLRAISLLDPSFAFAVGEYFRIFHTTDGGMSWECQIPIQAIPLTAVDFVSPELGWALGPTDVILRTTSGGADWSFVPHPTGRVVWDVQFVSPSVGWIVGNGGYIARSTNGGLSWQMQAAGTTQDLSGISALSGTEAWVSSFTGSVFRTTNGGQTWTAVPTGFPGEGFDAIAATPAGNIWAAGFAGTILAHLVEAPVTVALYPGATDVPRGGLLAFRAEVTNATSSPQPIQFWTHAVLPGGELYPADAAQVGPAFPGASATASFQFTVVSAAAGADRRRSGAVLSMAGKQIFQGSPRAIPEEGFPVIENSLFPTALADERSDPRSSGFVPHRPEGRVAREVAARRL